jgi:hypothetical protein
MNPLVAMEAMAREDGDDNNGEFSDAVERSAVAHRLKRNTSSKDLSFKRNTSSRLEISRSLLSSSRIYSSRSLRIESSYWSLPSVPTVIGLLVLYSLLPNWWLLFLSNFTKINS